MRPSAFLTTFVCAAGLALGATATEWPSFRGPSFDARASAPGLFAGLKQPTLAVDWRRPIGPGYSAVSVAGGIAATQFSDGQDEVLAAFDSAGGRELWRRSLGKKYGGHDGSHDGSIASPAIGDGRVFAFTPGGSLHAFAAADGKPLWTVDLGAEKDAEKPFYGHGSSPLLHHGRLWLEHTVKDKRLAAAFDPATGAPLLQAGQDLVGYHSPMVATLAGREQLLLAGMTKIYGLDGKTGAVLWEHAHEGDQSAMGGETIVPLAIPGDRLLITPKNDTSTLLRLVEQDGAFKIETLWSTKTLGRSYSRPVYHDGHFYGYIGGFLTCVKAEDGSQVWRSRPPGDGFLMLLEDHLVVLTKQGALHLAKASPQGYQEVAQLALFPDHAWTGPSFAGGRIYARSMGEIAAVRVVESAEGAAKVAANAALPADSAFRRFEDRLAAAPDKAKAVDDFLAGIASFPLVEGEWVHFLYRGEAQDLGITGDMIGARIQAPMRRLEGTDLYVYSRQLVPAARISYRFIKDYDNPIVDPRNPRVEAGPGTGPGAPPQQFSWVGLAGWVEPAFLAAAPAAVGTVERHVLQDADPAAYKRNIDVYLPPGYDPAKGPYPTVYVHGGSAPLEVAKLNEVFDRLPKSVAPFVAVFVDSIEPRQHPANNEPEPYVKDLVERVVPFVDGKYATRRDAAGRAGYGANYGGYYALVSAMQKPAVFGSVATHSATLLESDLPATLALVPPSDQGPRIVYLDWGRYDQRAEHEGWNIGRSNAKLAAALRERGYTFAGGELPEGGTWGAYRGRADKVFALLVPAAGN